AAPTVAGPRRTRGIRFTYRDRVPAPTERAAPRVVRADDAALEISRAIVTDRRADDHETAHDRRRRRHLVTAAVAADLDAIGQIPFPVPPEVGAWRAGCRVERDETRIARCDEDATATHGGARARIEPCRHTARRDDRESPRAVDLGVIAPSLPAGL